MSIFLVLVAFVRSHVSPQKINISTLKCLIAYGSVHWILYRLDIHLHLLVLNLNLCDANSIILALIPTQRDLECEQHVVIYNTLQYGVLSPLRISITLILCEYFQCSPSLV